MSKLKNTTGRNSLSYRFTVDTQEDVDLINLNRLVRSNNEWSKTKLRVCLMPRGKRVSNAYMTLVKDATHFYVYVYDKLT